MADLSNSGTSILLPVYLRKASERDLHFLARAIGSIEKQSFAGPFEIIVIDDGSPIPVEPLISTICHVDLLKHVRCVRSWRNGGIVDALNRGLAQSTFPFIARIDADDRWLPDKMHVQFTQFDEDPDLTISATGMTLVDPVEVALGTHIRPGDWNGILRFFIETGCPFPHGSIVARREIFSLLGGYSHDPATAHCEDYALWAIWLRFFKPAMIEQSFYHYTVHDASVSNQNFRQQATASREIAAAFRALDPVGRLPQALQGLAGAMGASLIQAGTLAYRMWRYHLTVALPRAAIEPMLVLLPDRTFELVPLASCRAADAERIADTRGVRLNPAEIAVRVI